jgi:hypothetical protein
MDADFQSLFRAFDATSSLSFAAFKSSWQGGGFSELHTVLSSACEREHLPAAYQMMYAHLFGYLSQQRPICWKAGAVYALYTLYCTQPLSRPEPIRIGPFEWQRLRKLYEIFCSVGSVGRDLCAVVSRLYHGGALLFAAYSGPVGFSAIAHSAQLYGLGELSPASDVCAPMVDHLAEVFGSPGSAPHPLPSKRQREAPCATAMGEGGSSDHDLGGDSDCGASGAGVSSPPPGLMRHQGRPPPRDTYAQARSRALGALVHQLTGGRGRQSTLALDAVLCTAARCSRPSRTEGAADGGAAGADTLPAPALAAFEAAVRGTGAWPCVDVVGRPDSSVLRLPIAFPTSPTPVFPGLVGTAGYGAGRSAPPQKAKRGRPSSASYAETHSSLMALLQRSKCRPWPLPQELLRDCARELRDLPSLCMPSSFRERAERALPAAMASANAASSEEATDTDFSSHQGEPGEAKTSVADEHMVEFHLGQDRALQRGRGRRGGGGGGARGRASPLLTPTCSSPQPLRDIPFLELLDAGTGVVLSRETADDTARLLARARRLLDTHIIAPSQTGGSVHAPPGAELLDGSSLPPPLCASNFSAESAEDIDAPPETDTLPPMARFNRLVESVRSRLGLLSWDNDVAETADCSPATDISSDAMQRLVLLSFAELREPPHPGALSLKASTELAPLEEGRAKPRGRNAAALRGRQTAL